VVNLILPCFTAGYFKVLPWRVGLENAREAVVTKFVEKPLDEMFLRNYIFRNSATQCGTESITACLGKIFFGHNGGTT
jgi:hypothetical protein